MHVNHNRGNPVPTINVRSTVAFQPSETRISTSANGVQDPTMSGRRRRRIISLWYTTITYGGRVTRYETNDSEPEKFIGGTARACPGWTGDRGAEGFGIAVHGSGAKGYGNGRIQHRLLLLLPLTDHCRGGDSLV